jgi:hypothetical protein
MLVSPMVPAVERHAAGLDTRAITRPKSKSSTSSSISVARDPQELARRFGYRRAETRVQLERQAGPAKS